MTDYTELVKALRHCEFGWSARTCDNCKYSKTDCTLLLSDAAAAIEELQAELERKRTADCFGCKCKKLEPKRGEWVHQEREFKDGKKIIHYVSSLANCSICGLETDTEYDVWNYCPNCGAKMGGME